MNKQKKKALKERVVNSRRVFDIKEWNNESQIFIEQTRKFDKKKGHTIFTVFCWKIFRVILTKRIAWRMTKKMNRLLNVGFQRNKERSTN